MGSSVRPLARGEVRVAAETLALAFDEDPLFRFFFPEAEARAPWLRWLMSHALTLAIDVGGAFVPGGGPEEGAMALAPPGAWPVPIRRTLAAFAWPPGPPSRRLLLSGLHVERRIQRLHPPGEHVYLHVLGVHPGRKGQGVGGGLLRHVASLAAAAGVVSHLETANPVNLPLYRRFGFEVRTEITSHGGPPLWTMTTPE